MSSNPFINGKKQLICIGDNSPFSKLLPHQSLCGVMGTWYKGKLGRDSLRLVNESLSFYYDVVNGIKSHHRNYSIKREEIRDSLTDGCGYGLSDLEELLHHIYLNNNMWIENSPTKWYTERPFLSRAQIDLPLPICNFATSISKKMREMQKYLNDLSKTVNQLRYRDIRELMSAIGKINEIVQKLDLYMWFNDSPIKRVGGKTFRYVDITMKIDSFVKNYADTRREFQSSKANALLFASCAEAIGLIPVLGEYYQKMLTIIPGLAGHFKVLLQTRSDKWRSQFPREYQYLIQ